ncbi:MAG: N-acetylmuramoyl-L-alanine amidase, partial [Bdellovibrionales bacterium]|nr:N-acetylmuramoyl-L-alanine amidase [Bdellovibrionales bacterium]
LNLTSSLKKDLPGVIKQAPFYVITKTKIPSVLIEVGFLSHSSEKRKLLRTDYQKELAEKIFESIQNYAYKSASQGKYLDEKLEMPK